MMTGFERIALAGAELWLDHQWLPAHEADGLIAALRSTIVWETHRLRMFGREVDSPRRSCWIGDPGAGYTYSRTRFEPRPWPAPLLPVRRRLNEALDAQFNSVLVNLYRDGRDRMGWHSDDEPELGPQPLIASLSLGATRRFVLKPREQHQKQSGSADRLALELNSGSLLIMRGETQRHYRHALPATARPVAERINLTFRRILDLV